ncbi:hypothetical protein RDWZM_004934 [Blomia tropicalis]|uniref:Uncharacterized protein n=1 Tax=Blomia tropicalis TaxID=40697 RepID=A0A9Q0M7R3_BLOTA|nr:hypothetical protein RDWZM_004934 [Blomia tropicalis]
MSLVSAAINDNQQVNEYDLLKDFKHFIEHFGHDAIRFLKCMGPSFVKHCSKDVLECMTSQTIIGCIGAIKCEGHDAIECIHHLKEDTTF